MVTQGNIEAEAEEAKRRKEREEAQARRDAEAAAQKKVCPTPHASQLWLRS